MIRKCEEKEKGGNGIRTIASKRPYNLATENIDTRRKVRLGRLPKMSSFARHASRSNVSLDFPLRFWGSNIRLAFGSLCAAGHDIAHLGA
jgi:hypothetical protein